MLTITIPAIEHWDEGRELFLTLSKEQELTLEHSLISLSKWESKWHQPFLSNSAMTKEQEVDYIRCMTINKNVDPQTYSLIPADIMFKINAYISDPMTATVFVKENKKKSGERITSELIYFWMINYSVPLECERWHLNRLLALINLCAIKAKPKKKLNQKELMERNRALNEKRKQELNTTG